MPREVDVEPDVPRDVVADPRLTDPGVRFIVPFDPAAVTEPREPPTLLSPYTLPLLGERYGVVCPDPRLMVPCPGL